MAGGRGGETLSLLGLQFCRRWPANKPDDGRDKLFPSGAGTASTSGFHTGHGELCRAGAAPLDPATTDSTPWSAQTMCLTFAFA